MKDTKTFLKDESSKTYYKDMLAILDEEYSKKKIFPKKEDIFLALELTPLEKTKVVIIGQDPYYREGQAEGLSFSVSLDTKKLPPSLKNIWKEIKNETGMPIPNIGSLKNIAKQGVLFLNTVFTVEEGKPNSHKGLGWERFTDELIKELSDNDNEIIFVLWGNDAKAKEKLIDKTKNIVLTSSHPSPLGARHSFFGSNVFNVINYILKNRGEKPINWSPYKFIVFSSELFSSSFLSCYGIEYNNMLFDELNLYGFDLYVLDEKNTVYNSKVKALKSLEDVDIDLRYGIFLCINDGELLKAGSMEMKKILLKTRVPCMLSADRYIEDMEEILEEIGVKR